MALHSHNVPGFKYRLWHNWDVPKDDPVDHMLGKVATVARTAPGGQLQVVVINCHGRYNDGPTGGYGLTIGENILRCHTSKFSVLQGLVGTIIITACGTARISPLNAQGDGDGNLFCCEIAKNSGAYVIAATTTQLGDDWLPDDTIDDFEGLTLRYDPQGAVDWSHDYGRSLLDGIFNGGWD
jgi:hypothetical protein